MPVIQCFLIKSVKNTRTISRASTRNLRAEVLFFKSVIKTAQNINPILYQFVHKICTRKAFNLLGAYFMNYSLLILFHSPKSTSTTRADADFSSLMKFFSRNFSTFSLSKSLFSSADISRSNSVTILPGANVSNGS